MSPSLEAHIANSTLCAQDGWSQTRVIKDSYNKANEMH